LIGLGVAGLHAAIVTFVLLKLIDVLVGLRVSPEVEFDGLDATLHGESAYAPGSTTAIHSRVVDEEEAESMAGQNVLQPTPSEV
jgi:hypothetical protein